LNVFSGAAGVDPLNASLTVLRAIPYIGDSDLDRIMKARRDGADRREIIDQVPDAEEFLLAESSGVYRVTVQARLSNGYSEAVEAVIISPDEDSADFRVVAWSKLAPVTRTQ
jgi:hypothetical protein